MSRKKTTPETKTLLLQMNNGAKRVTVPQSYKVTFGLVAPGKGRGGFDGSGDGGYCLRLYDGTHQVAVFCGVQEFRTLGQISISEKRISVKRRHVGAEGEGGYKNAVVEAKVEKWVDPDNEGEDDEDSSLLALAEGEGDWE